MNQMVIIHMKIQLNFKQNQQNQVFVIILMQIFQLQEILGNINVAGGDANTNVVFKNCAPFENCRTEINGTYVDYANFINITMPMYNLIEYSDNYSDTSGSLWNFKRDEIIGNINVTNNNSSSFKYNSNLIGDNVADRVNKKKEM